MIVDLTNSVATKGLGFLLGRLNRAIVCNDE